ncbi:MAG: GYF domain-containing protein [Deltaproteobacteria bacterium]|nr:GYF domain-containing protein [Deltaproteobacteria bacterium]
MRHNCEHCDTAYEIPDAKVAGRFVKVRCTCCRGTMHVVGVNVARTRVRAERWWAAIGNQARGPFSREEILLFVDLGDVSARTRLWTPGMAGWERPCESAPLGWVYARVVERLSADELLIAREPTRTWDPFANAALVSDGNGWFPDPTLKSGIFMLDEQTQAQLHKLAPRPKPESPSARAFTALFAASAGAAMAVGGFVWMLAENVL